MTSDQPTTLLPSGVVTFLLTDVADSTALWESAPQMMTEVITRHYEILHAAVTSSGGALPVEQGEGDSVVAAFRNGSDALAASLTAQQALAAEPWPDNIEIAVRMALHTGETQLRDLGNYAGETIIRAARLRALAHGRQIVASRQCVDLLGDATPDGVGWLDLGSYRLKGLGRPEQVFQVLHPDLPTEFPPLRGPDSVTNNLPTQLTPFIGREAELAQLHALLDDTRLLTVTGSGGCGKTRLALEAATDRIERHIDGIWYIELAPLGETSSVVAALAAVLQVRESAEETLLEGVVTRLADQRALIVIDNCEHLLEECATLVETLLRGCPPLQIVTTSRQPLNLPGEVTWRVPSLRSPKADEVVTVESLAQFDAVRLFIDRAVRSRPNFAIGNDNAPHVAKICEQLDGIPLAIELAAARVRSVSVSRIAEGLDDRFRMLRGGSNTLLPRQQTLYESIEWSHQLLTDDEKVLLRRLARFSGGFDLDAAEAVCSFAPLDEYAVLALLGNLVDRSLVVLDDEGPIDRYRLLETIKQFSNVRLEDSGETNAVLDRHVDHFSAVAHRLAPLLETGEQRSARPVLQREVENLRVALEHAASIDDPELLATLAVDLTLFWFQTAAFGAGDHWLALAAERLANTEAVSLGRLLWSRGYLNFYFGNFELAYELAVAGLSASERAGDPLGTARCFDLQADIGQLSAPMAAADTLERALELSRAAGDNWGAIDILQKVGFSYLYMDRFDDAHRWLDQAVSEGLNGDNPFFVAWHYNALGLAARRTGWPEWAEYTDQALAAADECGDLLTIGWAVSCRAEEQLRGGDRETAVELLMARRQALASRGASTIALGFIEMTLVKAATWIGDWAAADDLRPLMEEYSATGVGVGEQWTLEEVVIADLMRERDATASITRLAELSVQIQSPLYIGLASFLDAIASLQAGDPARGADTARRALEEWRGHGYHFYEMAALDVLGWAAAAGGDASTAGRLHALTKRARAGRGWAMSLAEQTWHEAAALHASDGATFAEGEASAEGLEIDEAIAMMLRSRGVRLRPASGWPSLTPTELEVVKLVGDGLSNPEIAERLFMGRSTVKTHLNHVFTKLDVSTRAELAAAYVRDRE